MSKLPRHVAIIMDGNGRWARQRNLPRVAGHEAGLKIVREIIQSSVEKKIEILTLFAFGADNWKRPTIEISFLMRLFLQVLHKETENLHRQNIQLRIIGDASRLSPDLQQAITQAQQLTAKNTGLILVLAISYSGRWDITQAMQKLMEKVLNQQLDIKSIDQTLIHQHLSLGDLPEPELLIRTSGEKRISDFMLWQLAYTELYFSEVYWPDFNVQEFEKTLACYASRERRFGKTSEQVSLKALV